MEEAGLIKLPTRSFAPSLILSDPLRISHSLLSYSRIYVL